MKKKRTKLIYRMLSAFLALCMIVCNTGFLSLASSLDTGEDLVTIHAAECENGHLMISSRVQSETIVAVGETVLVEPIADDGYMEESVVIQNDNGDVIAYNVLHDGLYSFTATEDVTVYASFVEDPDYVDDGFTEAAASEIDELTSENDIRDEVTEQYIRDHVNPEYTGMETMIPANMVTIFNTVADSSHMDGVDIIDGLFKMAEDNLEQFESAYVANFSTYAMLYDLDPESDYYVGWANTMHKDSNSVVTDCDFAYNNDLGQVLDNCIYDGATGLVYIHKSDFFEEDGTYVINNVRMQFLQMINYTGSNRSNVEIEVNVEEDVSMDMQSQNMFEASTTVTIDAGLNESEMLVCVNGIPMETGYSYNRVTGEMTLNMSSSSINTLTVETGDETFIQKVFDAFSPMVTEAESLATMNPICELPEGIDESYEGAVFSAYNAQLIYSDQIMTATSEAAGYIQHGPLANGDNVGDPCTTTYYVVRYGNDNMGVDNTSKYQVDYGKINAIRSGLYFYMDLTSTSFYLTPNSRSAMIASGYDVPVGRLKFDPGSITNGYTINTSAAEYDPRFQYADSLPMQCGHISQAVKDEIYNGFMPSDNNGNNHGMYTAPVVMRILDVDTTSDPDYNYCLVGIITGIFDTQAGAGLYVMRSRKFEEIPPEASIYIQKSSSNTDITDGNYLYHMAGAEYRITGVSGEAATDTSFPVTVTIGEDGKSENITITKPGTYSVVEISQPADHTYELNSTAKEFVVTADDIANATELDPLVFDMEDPPTTYHLQLEIQKINHDGSGDQSQGDGSLAGAVFTIDWYNDYYMTRGELPATPDKTFAITTSNVGGRYIATLDTQLPLGTFTIRETKAPEGYLLNDLKFTCGGKEFNNDNFIQWVRMENGDINITVGNQAINEDYIARGGVRIQKLDLENYENHAQGGATLEGTTFHIINISDHYVYVDQNGDNIYQDNERFAPVTRKDANGMYIYDVNKDVLATLVTDEDGIAVMDGSAGYTDFSLLPYGTYYLYEYKGPAGYTTTYNDGRPKPPLDGVFAEVFEIRQDGVTVDLTGAGYEFQNRVIRADIEFRKIESDTQAGGYDTEAGGMAEVAFRLTNVETGESHVVFTDVNGYFSTKSYSVPLTGVKEQGTTPDGLPIWSFTAGDGIVTDKSYMMHSFDTNAGDGYWAKIEAGEEVKIGPCGTWFGMAADGTQTPINDNYGALPYGTYLLEELRCPANEGKTNLYSGTFSITRDYELLDIGNLENRTLRIETTARTEMEEVDEGHYAPAWPATQSYISNDVLYAENVKITDECKVYGLEYGQEYYLYGYLFDLTTGEEVRNADGSLVVGRDEEGNVGKVFTARAIDMDVIDMSFTFDATDLVGHTVVVFEELYVFSDREDLGEDATPITFHKDMTDVGQSIFFPKIGTEARDNNTELNMSDAGTQVTITDTIHYSNLRPQVKYVFTGILMDPETGEAYIDPVTHKRVTASIEYVPETFEGDVEVEFTFNASEELAGKNLVIFEEMTRKNVLWAWHHDWDDEKQTVHFPKVTTTAVDSETLIQNAAPDDHITIMDRVYYENVIAHQYYRLEGQVYNAETGKPELDSRTGQPITAYGNFYASATSGEVMMMLTFSGVGKEGATLVMFEDLYLTKITDEEMYALIEEQNAAIGITTINHTEPMALMEGRELYAENIADRRTAKEIADDYNKTVSDNRVTFVEWHDQTQTALYTAEDPEAIAAINIGSGSDTVSDNDTGSDSNTALVPLYLNYDVRKMGVEVEYVFNSTEQLAAFNVASETEAEAIADAYGNITLTAFDGTTAFYSTSVDPMDVIGYGLENSLTELHPCYIHNTKPLTGYAETEEEARYFAQLHGVDLVSFEDGTAYYYTDRNLRDVLGRVAVSVTFGVSDEELEAINRQRAEDLGIEFEDLAEQDMISRETAIEDKALQFALDHGADMTGYDTVNHTAVFTMTSAELESLEEDHVVFELSGDMFINYVEPVTLFTVVLPETVATAHVGDHRVVSDARQQIYIPRIRTTVSDSESHDRNSMADSSVTLNDTVHYENLIPGVTYTVEGILMDKDTGMALEVDGHHITADTTFTAQSRNGDVTVTFKFNGVNMTGKRIVVFEDLYYSGMNLATHADINDEAQTQYFPKIGTTAKNAETGLSSTLAESINIKDTVQFTDLLVGHEYVLSGYLVDKATGEIIQNSSRSLTFRPTQTSGTVDMLFDMDLTAYAGRKIVVYEALKLNNAIVAEHKDITDTNQTFSICKTVTVALDELTRTHESNGTNSVTLIDTVQYEGLQPGTSYTCVGTLVYQDTGNSVMNGFKAIKGETTFTPESPSGTITITFKLDASKLQGRDVVCYEIIKYNGHAVCNHIDRDDKNQTISFPYLSDTVAVDTADGDKYIASVGMVSITDNIIYENFTIGNTYTIMGQLIDKKTGQPVTVDGIPVTGETMFTAEIENGTASVVYTFDSGKVTADTIVVFETLYNADGSVVNEHCDINDRDQTVTRGVKTGDSILWMFAGLAAMIAFFGAVIAARKKKKK